MREETDFLGVERRLLRDAREKQIPLNGSLALLPGCNLRCRMCYLRDQEKGEGILSLERWLTLSEELREAGTLFLMLTGGEPLLYPRFRELYQALRGMGFILTVNTNGTLIGPEWADFFAKNKPRRVNLTLYGTSREVYQELCGDGDACTRAFEAVRLLWERKVPLKINYSAVPWNRACTGELLSFCRERSLPVNIESYMFPGREDQDTSRLSPEEAAAVWYQNLLASGEDLSLLSRELTEGGFSLPERGTACLAGNCSFQIDWRGRLRPCALLTEPSVSLEDCSFAEAFRRVHEALQVPLFPEKCGDCDKGRFCRICPAAAEQETGSRQEPPPYLCALAEACRKRLITGGA